MWLNLLILWDSLLSFSWPADQQLLKMSLAKHFNWNLSSQQTECLTRCTPNFIQREKSLSGRLRSRQPSGELVFVPLCVSVLWSSSFARLPPTDVTVLSPSSSSLSRCQILFSVSSHAVCPPHQSACVPLWVTCRCDEMFPARQCDGRLLRERRGRKVWTSECEDKQEITWRLSSLWLQRLQSINRTLYKKSLSGTFYHPAFTRHVVSNLTLYWINKTV